MNNFNIFEISSEVFLWGLSIIILSIQILLCFKSKNNFIKLIPVIMLLILMVAFSVLIFVFDGWESIGFLFLDICSFALLVVCGIGWLIWFIVKKKKEKIKYYF